jgi:hypothetical protein
MRGVRAALAAFALLLAAPAYADPPEVTQALPEAQRVGETHYRALTFALASAELYAPHASFSWDQPFAVALTYEHTPHRGMLISSVIREMSKRGAGPVRQLAAMRAQLDACVPEIRSGDRVTGVSTGRDTAWLFHNGAPLCTLEWPNLRHYFFGIVLDGQDGPAAVLSAQLRGEIIEPR